MLSTVIPFSGFYDSLIDHELDRALEMTVSDADGNTRHGLLNALFDTIDWREVHVQCARDYVTWFSREFEIDLEFEVLNSPREYNFATDRIYCHIKEELANRLLANVNTDTFNETAEDRHTSFDGFISYYSPGVSEWGPIETWEAEQLHTLLLACLKDRINDDLSSGGFDRIDDYLDYRFIEWMSDDGSFDDLIYQHAGEKGERIFRINDYLNRREAR